jgi:hypothetical protein
MAAVRQLKQLLTVIVCLCYMAPSSAYDKSMLPNIDTEPLTRIAFGSCINQTIEQVGDPVVLLLQYTRIAIVDLKLDCIRQDLSRSGSSLLKA